MLHCPAVLNRINALVGIRERRDEGGLFESWRGLNTLNDVG